MSQTYNDRRTAARRRDEEPPARANAQSWIALIIFVAFLLLCAYIVATRELAAPPTAPQPTARPAVIAPASNPYLNNVGQQAPHVPRSEPTRPNRSPSPRRPWLTLHPLRHCRRSRRHKPL